MLWKKKRKDHVEENEDGDSEPMNFAWIVLIGMKIGYSEQEVAHMYLGKWLDLYEEFKKMHNMTMKRMIFEERKVGSLLDL